MKKTLASLLWIIVAVAGGWAYATIAFERKEPVGSIYILVAALCSYAIGYRFYSKWIAARVMALDDRRATPCEIHDDGKDFCKTNKWIVFGHHFAAISGPGPLVGPVLAAQFGYLPGTLWILIGVVLGGAVQDFMILFASMRRDGKSLGQMVKEELNTPAGYISLFAILAIMIILLAVLALVVVKALAESPWGIFTVGATIPIALFMGTYLRFIRVGRVLEASAIGVILLLLAVWGGRYASIHWAGIFGLKDVQVAWIIIVYGLAASILPVWLLLAPRDYLSTFMKLGTIFALAVGIFFVLPTLKMPALTQFVNGSGPVVAGKLFPFCFITIACGAISGFHTLISSGTTPKIIARESHSRPIGYGAMCLESLVAIMALIAACTLDPGVYLSMNMKGDPAATVAAVNSFQFPVTLDQMDSLAKEIGETTLFGRTGGAATLAVGMAHIFSNAVGGHGLDLWYHFAIMFEALFILTTIDAGTRVGRYILQDFLGNVSKPLGDTRKLGPNLIASCLVVSGWGYFLVQGVRDPLGGINSLWPLFGIANQMLAAIALCLATTIILKITLRTTAPTAPPPSTMGSSTSVVSPRSPLLALVTFIPLVWLLAVTMTSGVQKIAHPDPRIGFLAQAKKLKAVTADLESQRNIISTDVAAGVQSALTRTQALDKELARNRTLIFNNYLDAVVAGAFLVLVGTVVCLSVAEWVLLLARKKIAELRESPPVWLPDYMLNEPRRSGIVGIATLALLLVKELSGEAHLERAQRAQPCSCETHADPANRNSRIDSDVYVKATEERFNGIRRCC